MAEFGKVTLNLDGLERIMAQYPERAKQIVRETAFDAEGNMKVKCVRIDTGAMRASIHTKAIGFDGSSAAIGAAKEKRPDVVIADFPAPSQEADKFTAHVGPAVEYAIYHEYGTHKMAASPFVVPGALQAYQNFIGRMPGLFK